MKPSFHITYNSRICLQIGGADDLAMLWSQVKAEAGNITGAEKVRRNLKPFLNQ